MEKVLIHYKQLLGLQNALFSRIEHEDAMVAVVFKISQPGGISFILKICERPHDYLREVYFLNHFANTLPVPKIIQVVEPSKSIPGAILMEYLPGALLKPEDLTKTLAFEIGLNLALIHLNRLPSYGDPVGDNLSSEPRLYFTLKFEEGLEECSHRLPANLIEQCRHYYEAHLSLLDLVDGPCLVHRDFRPGNLIIHQGKLQGIIDWASTRASFAEEDFCSIEQRHWKRDSEIKRALLSGYASIRPIPNYERLLPFLRLNKAVATIGFLVKRGTWKGNSAPLYYDQCQILKAILDHPG